MYSLGHHLYFIFLIKQTLALNSLWPLFIDLTSDNLLPDSSVLSYTFLKPGRKNLHRELKGKLTLSTREWKYCSTQTRDRAELLIWRIIEQQCERHRGQLVTGCCVIQKHMESWTLILIDFDLFYNFCFRLKHQDRTFFKCTTTVNIVFYVYIGAIHT